MSLGKPTIKLCFMDDDMRDFAINEATKALETSNSEKVSEFVATTRHEISMMRDLKCEELATKVK